MTTRLQVAQAAHRAVLARLKKRRPKAEPWSFTRTLGRDDGAGYNFKDSTVRKMAREVYARMGKDPDLADIAALFVYPEGFPGDEMLAQTVEDFRAWIAADVCTQAGVA